MRMQPPEHLSKWNPFALEFMAANGSWGVSLRCLMSLAGPGWYHGRSIGILASL